MDAIPNLYIPNNTLRLFTGSGMGMALALLLELLNRRVRSVDDLSLSDEIRCIGVVEEPTGKSATRRFRRAMRGLIPQWTGAPA